MNEEWYGISFDRPAARMAELVKLLRTTFDAQKGGGLRFKGDFWDLKIPLYARPGAAREQIPIWIAAVNRKMIHTAGLVADGLVGHPIATRRWHREVTLPGIRAGEAEAGREEGACVLAPYVMCSIADSREQAIREVKGQIGFYYTTDLYHSILDLHGLREVGQACRAAFKRMDLKAVAEAVPDSLVDEIAIACTPDEARDRFSEWKDLTADPLFYPPSIGLRPARALEISHTILDTFGS
jgi:alkanesulfonate monooxygenase SsuD/methylene tetrahydromethanopterin reductase-like flavin-dependent oxidoreductase (luciferase family)